MSQQNAKPAGEGPAGSKEIGQSMNRDANYSYYSITRRRCLAPHEAALARLDSVEQRLQAARAQKDNDAFGRYYLAWLALHSLAFSYGKWAKGASDGKL